MQRFAACGANTAKPNAPVIKAPIMARNFFISTIGYYSSYISKSYRTIVVFNYF